VPDGTIERDGMEEQEVSALHCDIDSNPPGDDESAPIHLKRGADKPKNKTVAVKKAVPNAAAAPKAAVKKAATKQKKPADSDDEDFSRGDKAMGGEETSRHL